MACLLGVQRGYEMHVVDLAQAGPKRDLVENLGARYHAGDAANLDVDVDVVIECTGLADGTFWREPAARPGARRWDNRWAVPWNWLACAACDRLILEASILRR